MLVEFFGLPASGKSALAMALAERLRNTEKPAQYLSECARRLMAEAQKNVKYIARRTERVGIFGATWYGHKHPDIFHYLSHFSKNHPRTIYSNLEFLSELYFAEDAISKPGIVLTDEGLLHRGIAASLGRDDPGHAALKAYLDVLPREHAYIHIDITPELTIQRATAFRNRLPYSRGFPGRTPENILSEAAELTQIAVQHCQDIGLNTLTLDGTKPLDQLAEQLESSGLAAHA